MTTYVYKQNFYFLRELQIHNLFFITMYRTTYGTKATSALAIYWSICKYSLDDVQYLSKNAGDLLKGIKR